MSEKDLHDTPEEPSSRDGEAEVFVPPETPASAGPGAPGEEPGELELDSGRGGRDGWMEEDDEGRSGGSVWLVPGIVALVLVLSVGGWLWMRSQVGPPELPPAREAPPPPAPPAEADVAAPESETGTVPPLPSLLESDPWVRDAVQSILEHPRLGSWLAPEGLVTRFVASVDDIARGESPRAHLVSLDPGRGFRVDETAEGAQRISTRSFRRYDPLVDAFVALDTPEAMRLYREMEPLFREAYRDLGYPDAEFRAALETAIDRLLEVEVPSEPPEVKPRITSWAYADPELEGLSAAEKHLLRLGPRNARKIQSKLRALKTALTLEPGPGAS